MSLKGRGMVAVVAVSLGALGAASVAWACTPQANLVVRPGSGEAGARVAVSGERFAEGPVEIRWNGPAGALLTTANGPSFTTSVTVPQSAAARTYYIVALARNADGTTVGTASGIFTVTSSQASPAAPANSGGDAAGQGATEPAPVTAPAGDPASAPVADQSSPGSATPVPTDNAGVKQESAAGARPPAVASTRAAPAGRASSAARATSSAPARVASASTATPATEASAPSETVVSPEQVPVPAASVSGDLWGGFADGTLRGPSVADSPATASTGSSSALGVALLSVGIAGLFSGALVAARKRSRVSA